MKQQDQPAKRYDPEDVTRTFVLNIVLPGWTLAGLLDWYWHRLTKIERNAGAHESMTHLLMACEGGISALAPLVFEINAAVVAIVGAAALAHEATVIWDVNYAMSRRKIHQYEQHTHSFMEVLPFANVAVMALMHPEQIGALVGLSSERPCFRLRFKRDPAPPQAIAVVLACGVFGVLPHVEEFIRCLRAKPTLAPQPSHAETDDKPDATRE